MSRISRARKEGSLLDRKILRPSLLIGAVVLTGCNQGVQTGPELIMAVEPITCDFVVAIAPPSNPVKCLITGNQDVHNLRLSPKQVQGLNNASQIITLGQEMTPAIKKWLSKPEMIVVGVSAIKKDLVHQNGNNLLEEDQEEHHDEHIHFGDDPHIWHEPNKAMQMTTIIYNGIKRDIPIFNRKSRKLLDQRYKTVISILSDLDQWNNKQVSSIPKKNRWITSKHKSLEHYGDRYGLKTLSLLDYIGHSSGLRPQTLSKVIGTLKDNNIKVLFTEQQPASKLLRNLSSQSRVPLSSKPIYVDGLIPKGSTISTAVHNTCTIVNSLGGSCNQRAGELLEARWQSLTR